MPVRIVRRQKDGSKTEEILTNVRNKTKANSTSFKPGETKTKNGKGRGPSKSPQISPKGLTPERRKLLLDAAPDCTSVCELGRKLGMAQQTISGWCRKHPDFRDELYNTFQNFRESFAADIRGFLQQHLQDVKKGAQKTKMTYRMNARDQVVEKVMETTQVEINPIVLKACLLYTSPSPRD